MARTIKNTSKNVIIAVIKCIGISVIALVHIGANGFPVVAVQMDIVAQGYRLAGKINSPASIAVVDQRGQTDQLGRCRNGEVSLTGIIPGGIKRCTIPNAGVGINLFFRDFLRVARCSLHPGIAAAFLDRSEFEGGAVGVLFYFDFLSRSIYCRRHIAGH